MKKVLSVILCISLIAVLSLVFGLQHISAVSATEIDDVSNGLLTKYYNGGIYTRESTIFADDFNVTDAKYYHAGANTLKRTTDFYPTQLYMYNAEKTINSGYKDDGVNMYHYSIKYEKDIIDYTVENTTVENFFDTLYDLKDASGWQSINDKYILTGDNIDYIKWIHFVAPMWVGEEGDGIEINTVAMYESDNKLYLQLLVGETLFAQSIITNKVTKGLSFTLNADNSSYSVTDYDGSDPTVFIPAYYKGIPVTGIADYAFDNCDVIREIIIPNTIISIGAYAIRNCKLLNEIILPDSVISVGQHAFSDNEHLIEVRLSQKLKNLGNYAFAHCSNLSEIKLPYGVESVGNWAFTYCQMLKSINIPNSVESMGKYVFEYCSRLTIYCEAESKPSTWISTWNNCTMQSYVSGDTKCPVVWGYIE
ncbi:MAG: leucine-rich repeat domain-containing protein [Clostridia bacterium]|nr:leucine-rich repeat domain-containing protein [Clostridia bacterium]